MVKSGVGMSMAEQETLLPHEAFATLYQQCPQAFAERVVGSPGKLQEFWRAVHHPRMLAGHDLLGRNNYQQMAVPISLHGDGVLVAGVGKASWKFCIIGIGVLSQICSAVRRPHVICPG